MEHLTKALNVLQLEGVLEPKKLINYVAPQELHEQLNLGLGDEASEEELWKCLEKIVQYSVKTCHPGFMNQLYGAMDHFGLAGEFISSALNTNPYTFEVSPTLTLCEMEVIEKVLNLVGFTEGEGLFTPGGSIANMYGLVLARFKKFPHVKEKGMAGLPTLVVFTSTDAHYSITKSCNWLGIGTENIVNIETDVDGKMIPEELEAAIKMTETAGKVPLLVNATAGTTVLGAIDPISKIGEICEKFGVWLHVDACWGGSLLFSQQHLHKLLGINRANSISWDPHKMLGCPLQCSIFLNSEKGLLHDANSAGATYLFQKDKMYDMSYDFGDKSVQCSRKTDSLKLWTMWKARGDTGFEKLIDTAIEYSCKLKEKIKSQEGFKLLPHQLELTNVCFWYIPKRLRNRKEDDKWWEEINKVGPKLKEKLILNGNTMFSYQPLHHRGLKNFFRIIITCHPLRSDSFIDELVNEIDSLGKNL